MFIDPNVKWEKCLGNNWCDTLKSLIRNELPTANAGASKSTPTTPTTPTGAQSVKSPYSNSSGPLANGVKTATAAFTVGHKTTPTSQHSQATKKEAQQTVIEDETQANANINHENLQSGGASGRPTPTPQQLSHTAVTIASGKAEKSQQSANSRENKTSHHVVTSKPLRPVTPGSNVPSVTSHSPLTHSLSEAKSNIITPKPSNSSVMLSVLKRFFKIQFLIKYITNLN